MIFPNRLSYTFNTNLNVWMHSVKGHRMARSLARPRAAFMKILRPARAWGINMVIRIRYRYLVIAIIFILTVVLTPVVVKSTSTETVEGIYLPIMMYHEIKTYKLGKDVISPYEFESDLKYLQANNYNTITMTQLIDCVHQYKALPENPIILSFDDGYLSTYKYAFPLLKKYNMKIVFSIIGKNSDDFTQIPDNNIDYSHVTWDQLKEMTGSGYVEVQNHTYNLHKCKGRIGCMQNRNEEPMLYEQILTNDICLLQEKILSATGTLPNTFAYPYGRSSENTLAILKKLNFKAVLTCKYGVNIITDNPETLYELKRICRSHNSSIKRLIKQANKTLKYVKQ